MQHLTSHSGDLWEILLNKKGVYRLVFDAFQIGNLNIVQSKNKSMVDVYVYVIDWVYYTQTISYSVGFRNLLDFHCTKAFSEPEKHGRVKIK